MLTQVNGHAKTKMNVIQLMRTLPRLATLLQTGTSVTNSLNVSIQSQIMNVDATTVGIHARTLPWVKSLVNVARIEMNVFSTHHVHHSQSAKMLNLASMLFLPHLLELTSSGVTLVHVEQVMNHVTAMKTTPTLPM